MPIFRRRKQLQDTGASSSPTQVMNLSLFIMLLAFFIVLNANSSFEDVKVRPVIDSLETAFSTDVRRSDDKPSVTPDPLRNVHEGATVDRLNALFQAQIRAFDATKNTGTGTMAVEMPLNEFSESIMALGQRELTPTNRRTPPRRYFLPTLVSILQSDKDGAPYRMDIFLHSAKNPAVAQNRTPENLREAIKSADLLAQRLQGMGMAEKHIGIGVKKGKPEMVTLLFRRHVPFSPEPEDEAEEGKETP